MSSSNSSGDKQPEKGCSREELNLNESATALQLGPPAGLKPTGQSDVVLAEEEAAGPENPAKRPAYHLQQNSTVDVKKPVAEAVSTKNQRKIIEEFRAKKAAQDAKAMQSMQHNVRASYPGAQSVFPGAKNNGVKRGFSEAVGTNFNASSGAGGAVREGNCDMNRGEGVGGTEQPESKVNLHQSMGMSRMAPGSGGQNGSAWRNINLEKMQGPLSTIFRKSLMSKITLQDAGDSSIKCSSDVINRNKAIAPASNEQPLAQNQTVGWPPVKNFNKNNTPAPPPSAPATACRSVPMPRRGASSSSSGNLVKIYMDGVPFGRKVDLKTNNSYEKLYYTLEDMFQHYINVHGCGGRSSSCGDSHSLASSRKLNFLEGSEYVLIYEDHEGDSMLVGDVPWDWFIDAVKRLRIMKGSEQVNLAPKNPDSMKAQGAVG